jgi:uncharacterized cupredoxin-like copper-binding protein
VNRRAAGAALGLVLLSGCGAGSAEPVPDVAPTHELRIGMQDYRFQLSTGAVLPGPLDVVVTNAGGTAHDVVLEQDGTEIGRSDVLPPGDRQTVTVHVVPGTPVHLECTVTGHAQMGMQADLDVAGS